MFYQINSKKRFAIANTELNLKKFNLFFYQNQEINSFEIIRTKWILEDAEDDFFKKNSFCRLTKKKQIFLNLKQLNFYFLLKFVKYMFKQIYFVKNQSSNNNKPIFESSGNITFFNEIFFISLISTFFKKNVSSQCINFFFVKKLHYREFFKKKVQLKNHSFSKSIVHVDLFSKKLIKQDFNFSMNFSKVKTLDEKISKFLQFKPTNTLLSKKKFVFFKKLWISKPIKKYINCLYDNYPINIFLNLNIFFQKRTIKAYPSIFSYNVYFNKIIFSKNNEFFIKQLYTINLLKLANQRNNYLTNGFSNFSHFSNFKNFSNEDVKNTLNYLPVFYNKYISNNFLPYFNFNVKSQFYKNVVLRNILSPNFTLYYSYYLFNFLEVFLKRKVWLKINTKVTSIISPKISIFINDVFNKNKSDQFSVGRHFYLLEFLEILYISLFYRDLKFFSYWFKKTMEKLHLKKHRKLIKVIQNTLKNNPEFLNLLNVKGFTMDVRGKLGTTGNSKKKHYAFTVGAMSPTSKNHDMSMNQTTVRTNTGVLGVTITLSY